MLPERRHVARTRCTPHQQQEATSLREDCVQPLEPLGHLAVAAQCGRQVLNLLDDALAVCIHLHDKMQGTCTHAQRKKVEDNLLRSLAF